MLQDFIQLKKRELKLRLMRTRAISAWPSATVRGGDLYVLSVDAFPDNWRTASNSLKRIRGRGLHSLTFRLTVSALYGIGGAFKG